MLKKIVECASHFHQQLKQSSVSHYCHLSLWHIQHWMNNIVIQEIIHCHRQLMYLSRICEASLLTILYLSCKKSVWYFFPQNKATKSNNMKNTYETDVCGSSPWCVCQSWGKCNNPTVYDEAVALEIRLWRKAQL